MSGYGKKGRFQKVDLKHNLGIIDLNIKALVELTYIGLKYMDHDSKIIQVASIAGYLPLPGNSIYAASKAFVLNFTIALNAELRNIHVMALCPGPVNTEFFQTWGGDHWAKKRASPQKVVKKALKDLKKGRWVSTYSIKMQVGRVVSKALPRKWAAKLIRKFA